MKRRYARLLREGRIRPHRTNPAEIADLFAVVERDLTDAAIEALSSDRRLATSYNAALQAATAMMYAEGYRTTGVGHHRTTFEFLGSPGFRVASHQTLRVFVQNLAKRAVTLAKNGVYTILGKTLRVSPREIPKSRFLKAVSVREFGDLADYLDDCRRKRNRADYVGVGYASDTEARYLLVEARKFAEIARTWIRVQHPNLTPV